MDVDSTTDTTVDQLESMDTQLPSTTTNPDAIKDIFGRVNGERLATFSPKEMHTIVQNLKLIAIYSQPVSFHMAQALERNINKLVTAADFPDKWCEDITEKTGIKAVVYSLQPVFDSWCDTWSGKIDSEDIENIRGSFEEIKKSLETPSYAVDPAKPTPSLSIL